MESMNSKSVATAREEALKIGNGYIRGMKFSIAFFVVFMIVVMITAGWEVGLVVSVLLFIIGFISIAPIFSRYKSLLRNINNEQPILCKATSIGYERVGKNSYPAVHFDYEGQNGWATIIEEKDKHTIEADDYIYVWRSSTRKKIYIAIYAGEGIEQ